MKKFFTVLMAFIIVLSFAACGSDVPADRKNPEVPQVSENPEQIEQKEEYPEAVKIFLSENGADFSDEYADRISVGGEIIYYHDIDEYESKNPYGDGAKSDKHTEDEAKNHTLITIKKPGEYVLSGNLYGQVAVDLGEDAKDDPNAKVTIVLDNAEINCDIAPAIIFYNVYEPENSEDAFGANIIIADKSVNDINGAYVAKIYKDSEEKETLYKFDGAVYSKMSMSIGCEDEKTGVLNINGTREGIGSEMHLTVNGGNINITSADDGINANEDNVSVITINDGTLVINGGMEFEGDGIDSNGSLIINGGTLYAAGMARTGDSGMDADNGIVINGGTVVAFGTRSEAVLNSSGQVFVQLNFSSMRKAESTVRFETEDGNGMTAQCDREYQGLVLSRENLEMNKIYYLYVDDVLQEYSKIGEGIIPVPDPGRDFGGRIDFGEIEDGYLDFPKGFGEWLENAEDIPEEIKEWLEELYRTKRRPDVEIPPQPKPRTEIMGEVGEEASSAAGLDMDGSLVTIEELYSVEFVITEDVNCFYGISDRIEFEIQEDK